MAQGSRPSANVVPNHLRSCVLFAVLCLQACATIYSAKPITATVVDAESGEPLEGVNVVAHWVMHDPAWRSAGDLELMEAVTNKEGKFHIPGWGPRAIPSDLPMGTRLGNDDPGLILFKSGYKVAGLSNMSPPNRLRPEHDIRQRNPMPLEKGTEIFCRAHAGTGTVGSPGGSQRASDA